jgi:hemoglobin-like flavoprotein
MAAVATTASDITGGEEGGEAAAGDQGDGVGDGEVGKQVDINTLQELALTPEMVAGTRDALNMLISSAPSKEAAADIIYQNIFDSAKAVQKYFTTPRAVQAAAFTLGIAELLANLDSPPDLKTAVETLSFKHLSLPVTVPLVIRVRDGLLDLFQLELMDKLTTSAVTGWTRFLNYVGGGFIYVKAHYAERLLLIKESWAIASLREGDGEGSAASGMQGSMVGSVTGSMAQGMNKKKADEIGQMSEQNVPKTFSAMYQWNAVVGGYSASMAWMAEVVDAFHNIVVNIANAVRLSEECEFLTARISRATSGKVVLNEYKTCMLASMRSLLPKGWTQKHEFAWSWLWDNVERILSKDMGKPPMW